MTVKEMLQRMDAKELNEWIAFYGLEPWGYPMSNHRAGMICSVIANVNRDAKRRKEPYRAADFFPAPGEQSSRQEEQQTWQEQLEIVKILHEAFGGRLEHHGS